MGYRAGYNNGSSATNLVHGNNTGIGAFALNAVNSGDNNTSLGYVSGYSVTSGAYNLFLGYYAGINVSTGNNNICIGSGSAGESAMSDQLRIGNGASLTTISASLATGHLIVNSLDVNGAFNATTTGSSNTTIGSGSGEDLTTGIQNIFMGALAGKDNTTGDANVFIGYEAGETNTLGANNVAMGYQAGKNLGTGTANDNNVAIGYKAGMGSGYTDANYNVFIGHQAGIDATSGDSNIGLGFNSLFELKGGSNNVALGYQTGVNITSGAKNVMIGYEAGFKVSTGGNNIFIGEGSNGTELGGETGTSNTLRIGIDDVVAISASLATGDIIFPSTASADYFVGDGSQLSNLPASSTFPFTGDAQITGSLVISGSFHAFTLDSDNVVLGQGAGASMEAGANNNVLLGVNAGDVLSTGDDNVVIGTDSGGALSTGVDNVIIGNQAGRAGNMSDSVLIGNNAGDSNSSNQVIAIGDYAGRYGGAGDVSVGYTAGGYSGGGATTGHNTSIGHGAGEKLGSGAFRNVIVGWQSGYKITSGDYNTTIGPLAGINLATGDRNIVIGYSSSLASDSDDQLVIGYGLLATISASLVTGETIVRSQRPFQTIGTNPFTASADNVGNYFRMGGNVTCSIKVNATASCPVGAEFDFFQTSSALNVLFEADPGVTINSKNDNLNLSGQFSSATIKKVGTDEWDLMGDLT